MKDNTYLHVKHPVRTFGAQRRLRVVFESVGFGSPELEVLVPVTVDIGIISGEKIAL